MIINKLKNYLAVGLMGILSLSSVSARSEMSASELIKLVTSPVESRQKSGLASVLGNRERIVENLILFLQNADSNVEGGERQAIVRSIELLGKLRAMAAAKILVSYINFPRTKKLEHIRTTVGINRQFPATEALRLIGKPSIGPILERVPDPRPFRAMFLRNCAWIISNIEGPDLLGARSARFHLKLMLKEEKNEERRKGIEEVMQYIIQG